MPVKVVHVKNPSDPAVDYYKINAAINTNDDDTEFSRNETLYCWRIQLDLPNNGGIVPRLNVYNDVQTVEKLMKKEKELSRTDLLDLMNSDLMLVLGAFEGHASVLVQYSKLDGKTPTHLYIQEGKRIDVGKLLALIHLMYMNYDVRVPCLSSEAKKAALEITSKNPIFMTRFFDNEKGKCAIAIPQPFEEKDSHVGMGKVLAQTDKFIELSSHPQEYQDFAGNAMGGIQLDIQTLPNSLNTLLNDVQRRYSPRSVALGVSGPPDDPVIKEFLALINTRSSLPSLIEVMAAKREAYQRKVTVINQIIQKHIADKKRKKETLTAAGIVASVAVVAAAIYLHRRFKFM
jgi:hypothetical protein